MDARWTKKNGKAYFGYKNHISVDVKNKFIRKFEVTDASVHGSRVFKELLGVQLQKAGNLIVRTVGKARAFLKIGLRNLAYNLDRYSLLASRA